MSQYVLEWSRKQNQFHIQPLEHTLSANQTKFILDDPINDYHIIFIGSKDSCSTMADNWRSRLVDRCECVEREQVMEHITMTKLHDETYAKWAHARYSKNMPWLQLPVWESFK